MADLITTKTASSLLYTGPGYIAGLIVTNSNAAAETVTIYDAVTAVAPKIFEAHVNTNSPLIIFFSDKYAIRFAVGAYLVLAADLTATLWVRGV
jgi:hypothetical protein